MTASNSFRERHSALHPWLDVITLTYDAMRNNFYTALLLMVLHKAFNTLFHYTVFYSTNYIVAVHAVKFIPYLKVIWHFESSLFLLVTTNRILSL